MAAPPHVGSSLDARSRRRRWGGPCGRALPAHGFAAAGRASLAVRCASLGSRDPRGAPRPHRSRRCRPRSMGRAVGRSFARRAADRVLPQRHRADGATAARSRRRRCGAHLFARVLPPLRSRARAKRVHGQPLAAVGRQARRRAAAWSISTRFRRNAVRPRCGASSACPRARGCSLTRADSRARKICR